MRRRDEVRKKKYHREGKEIMLLRARKRKRKRGKDEGQRKKKRG